MCVVSFTWITARSLFVLGLLPCQPSYPSAVPFSKYLCHSLVRSLLLSLFFLPSSENLFLLLFSLLPLKIHIVLIFKLINEYFGNFQSGEKNKTTAVIFPTLFLAILCIMFLCSCTSHFVSHYFPPPDWNIFSQALEWNFYTLLLCHTQAWKIEK